jgi:DNA repair exonuclease SbcCD ATPase subunit
MMAELQKMVQNANSLQTTVENNSKSQVEDLMKSKSKLEEFTQELQGELNADKSEANLLQNNSKDLTTRTEATLNSEIAKFNSTYKSGTQKLDSLQEKIERQNQHQKENWQKTQEFISTESNEREEHLKKFEQEHQELANAMENKAADKIKELLEVMDTERGSEQEFITQGINELGEHCNSVSKWADATRAGVLQQSGKLVEFWESTYVIDLPSGMTPLRKIYDFPRNLSATSPHERIINRFTSTRRAVPLDENELF